MSHKAVFLDRDGTLIEDTGYIHDPSKVRLVRGAAPALRKLKKLGYLLVVVTNQSGIARGLLTLEQMRAVQQEVEARFGRRGVTFDAFYFCPHGPEEGCGCRKPKPGLLLRAAADLGIELSQSYMVGDKWSDSEAGMAAGCNAVLLAMQGTIARRSAASGGNVFVAKNWAEVADYISGTESGAQDNGLRLAR